MAKNAALLTGGLVAAAALLALGAWWFLDDGTTSSSTQQPDAVGPETGPDVTHVEPAVAVRDRHMYPYPFGDFLKDIEIVRRPGKKEVFREIRLRESAISETLIEKRISITMKDTPRNVIEELKRLYAGTDVKILTGPPYLPDSIEVDLDMQHVPIQDIVMEMSRQTQDRIDYRITPLGFAIGTKNACRQTKLDALEWERQRRAAFVAGARDDPLLEKTYRPDLRDAHIGAVARDLKEKTGVETVIGPTLWEKAVKLTWKNDPMRLEEALDGLAERLKATWYVKDGRIFLLAR